MLLISDDFVLHSDKGIRGNSSHCIGVESGRQGKEPFSAFHSPGSDLYNQAMPSSHFNCFLIAAQTADGFIARHAHELSTRWTSKEDAAFYRQKSTEAGVIVMGRSTYETFNKPLPNRVNLVYTRTLPSGIDQVANATVLEKGRTYFTGLPPQKLIEKLIELGFAQLAVSGGASVYQQFVASGVVTQMWLTVEDNVQFGEGIPLFAPDYQLEKEMQLVETIDLSPVTKVRHYEKREA
jgi:dihydrofolate reductase